MTTPSFQGLNLALAFPDTRIRFPSDVPASPSPRIIGMQIVSGGSGGFFKDIVVAFSDNLSCLIGPRGSGKSAIVESLRYAFGLNRMLKQLDPTGNDIAKKVRDLQLATLSNCIIRVIYLKTDGQTHILEATFDPKQDYTTKVFDVKGDQLEIIDLNTTGAYPLRLFGWSEIEMLGREPDRQRDLLDRIIPDFQHLLDTRMTARRSLGLKRLELESRTNHLAEILNRNNSEIKGFKEFQSEFNRLNTPEIDRLFAEIDSAKEQLDFLNKVKLNLQQWRASLSHANDYDTFATIGGWLQESPVAIKEWWVTMTLGSKIEEGQTKVKAAITEAMTELTKIDAQVQAVFDSVTAKLQQKEKELRDKVGQETTKQIAVDMRSRAAERLEKVNKLREEYSACWSELQKELAAWELARASVITVQGQITIARQTEREEIVSKLNAHSTEEMTIGITFIPDGDRNNFALYLEEKGFLSKKGLGNYKANFLPERLSLACTPTELSRALLDKDQSVISRMVRFNGQETQVETATASQLINATFPFAHDLEAEVDAVDKEKLNSILSIAEVEWDDDERIVLNGKQVNSLSPGQRSSAMLPLIALAENAPLIIDQPEDNLDNKLVGKVLVDILTNLKERRQIIVTTHNPNIVVSGDAEQVIVLDAISDHEGSQMQYGSIDKDPIIKSVIDIMEGGKQAFRNRQRRYGKRV